MKLGTLIFLITFWFSLKRTVFVTLRSQSFLQDVLFVTEEDRAERVVHILISEF